MSGRPIVTDAMRDAARALHTVPGLVADAFGVKPEWVERLLAGRGQRCREGESIRDCVARHYGEDAAALVERCIVRGE